MKLIAFSVKAHIASEDDSDCEMDILEGHEGEDGEHFGLLKLPTGWTREHRRRQRGDRAGQRYSVYFGEFVFCAVGGGSMVQVVWMLASRINSLLLPWRLTNRNNK